MGEHWRMPSGRGRRHLLADKGPFPSETVVNDGWVAGRESRRRARSSHSWVRWEGKAFGRNPQFGTKKEIWPVGCGKFGGLL